MKRVAPIALALLLPAAALAESHELSIGLRVDELSGGDGGFQLDGDWSLRLPQAFVSAGMSHATLSGSEWIAGRLALSREVDERLGVHAEARLGRGDENGSRFHSTDFRTGFFLRLPLPFHLVEAGTRYLDVKGASGALVEGALTARAGPRGTVRVGAHRSVRGVLDLWTMSLGTEQAAVGRTFFGGVTLGEDSGLDPVAQLAAPPQTGFYAGMRTPWGAGEMTLLLETSESRGFRRSAAAIVGRVEL